MNFLDAVVARLPVGLQPYAKALVPVVVAAVAVLVQWVESDTFSTEELWTAVGGFVVFLLTYLTPNRGYVTNPAVDDPDNA